MRTAILTYLRNETLKKKPREADVFNLAPFLVKTFPDASPKSVKILLQQMNQENVINASGDYGSLGASFGGVVKGLKDVIIHAQITDKGKAELPVAPRRELPAERIPITPAQIIPKKDPVADAALKVLSDHISLPVHEVLDSPVEEIPKTFPPEIED